ncbi:MAG TPA: hypothetical protein VNT76_11885, partial [Candidatus Binatus sp.]|nr:hypothetical protein [Candidatus Binatus sp.]
MIRPLLALAIAIVQLAGCAGDGLFGPARQASPPAPAAPKPAPAPPLPEYRGPATRPFFMGFTGWPADLNAEGLATAQEFAHAHGDIVALNFISGVPWPEAFDGKPFSNDV